MLGIPKSGVLSMQLAKGVYHVGFLNKVKKILECICTNCGKLKADV